MDVCRQKQAGSLGLLNMWMTWFRYNISMLLVSYLLGTSFPAGHCPDASGLGLFCPGGRDSSPPLCIMCSRAKSALGSWLRQDVTRAWPDLLCFHKQKNYIFMSFLQVPRLVKVVLESSPYFKLISPNDMCCKVAPGMSSTFRILFTPEENKVRPEVPRGCCLQ